VKRRWSLPARALLGLLVSAGILGLTEGGLRLAGVQPPYQADLDTWRMAPNRDHESIATREGARFTFSTNADGLRTSASREKTEGVRRVMLMGDSTVFGWGVDDTATLASGLQRELDDQYGYLGEVEVIDGGQPGYSTAQVSWFFDQIARFYQPDLVVVFIPGHDGNLGVISDWELLEGGQTWTASTRVFLAQRSRIYQLLRLVAYPRAQQEVLSPIESDNEHRVPRTSTSERAMALDRMRDQLAAWGGQLVVGMLPWYEDLTGGSLTERQDAPDILACTEQLGVRLLDLRTCCRNRPDFLLPTDTGHYSETGNLAVGALMAPTVVDELFLRRISEGKRGD